MQGAPQLAGGDVFANIAAGAVPGAVGGGGGGGSSAMLVRADGSIPIPDKVVEKLTWKHPHSLAGSRDSGTSTAAQRKRERCGAKDVSGLEIELRDLIINKPAWEARDRIRDALQSGRTRVNKRNPANGHAMLHTAASGGAKNGELVKMLLHEFNADPNVNTYLGGDKPLLYAAQAGARQIVFFLLSAGANPLAANRLGQTALHLAATKNTARVLLEWGANIWARDKFNRTPLDCALEAGHDDVVAYLSEIAQELMILQAERDHEAKHHTAHLKALEAAAKEAQEQKGKKLPETVADRIRADYIEWRRGEAGKKEREKEKRRKKAGADTMKNLSVFHSRLPGQYLGKARSSTSAVT